MPSDSPNSPEIVRAQDIDDVLTNAAFVRGYGFRLEALADGSCALRLPSDPRHLRPGGVVSGIVLLAAADLAMWFAIMTRVGREAADRSVTIDIKTNFLRGARGDIVTTARWVGVGEQGIFGLCEARDDSGTLIAHHALTYVDPVRQTP